MNRSPSPENRFPPGKSGNPSGRPRLPPELLAIKELTGDEMRRLVAKYARMTRAQVEAVIEDPETPILEVSIAAILAQSAKNGDYGRLAFLLDRTIGRAPVEEIGEPSSEKLLEMVKARSRELLVLTSPEQNQV